MRKMSKAVALVFAASLLGSAASAQTTVIEKETMGGSSRTTIKERDDGTVVKKQEVESNSGVGCETKSVTRTNELGDRTTKTKTDC